MIKKEIFLAIIVIMIKHWWAECQMILHLIKALNIRKNETLKETDKNLVVNLYYFSFLIKMYLNLILTCKF